VGEECRRIVTFARGKCCKGCRRIMPYACGDITDREREGGVHIFLQMQSGINRLDAVCDGVKIVCSNLTLTRRHAWK